MDTEDLYRLLRIGHIQAQGIVDTVPDPLLVLDEGLRVQAVSRSFLRVFKVERDDTVGRTFYELGDGQWNIPELRRLLVDVLPKASAIIDYQVEHNFPDLGRRTMLVTARTLHHPDGGSRAMLVSIVDVSERNRRDDAKDMLLGELRHRMKNLLAVAQSIARNTSTEGRSAKEYRDDFLGRFDALVEAQNLAFAEQEETGLAVLIERVLAPYTAIPEAVVIEPGAAVELQPRMMMSLSLILHELATNAAKYGALSAPGGKVHINWQVETAMHQLRLNWIERGGPIVKPPSATGYGTRLIDAAATHNLSGHIERHFEEMGLQSEIVIPLGDSAAPANG